MSHRFSLMRTTTFYLIIAGAIATLGVYNFATYYTLNNEISQLSNIVKNVNYLSDKQLKEDTKNMLLENMSYSDQLNRQSDQFIYYSSALFFILGLFGITVFYRIIDIRLREAKNSVYKAYSEHKKDYEIHKKNLNELNSVLYETKAVLFWIEADRNATKTYLFIRNSIAAAEAFRESFKYSSDKDAIEKALTCLKNTKLRLASNPEIIEFKMSNFSISGLKDDLKKTSELDELHELCSELVVKISELFKRDNPTITNEL